MTLEQLQKEMIQAMKNGEKGRKQVLSSLVGAVKKAAIDKNCRNDITEELVNAVLLKEQKIRGKGVVHYVKDVVMNRRVITINNYINFKTITYKNIIRNTTYR